MLRLSPKSIECTRKSSVIFCGIPEANREVRIHAYFHQPKDELVTVPAIKLRLEFETNPCYTVFVWRQSAVYSHNSGPILPKKKANK